jgi:hypothetical protein
MVKLNIKFIFYSFLFFSISVNAEQHRSQKAKVIFKFSHPCPSTGRNKGTCPDFIIDHIKPLACGGLDEASNMQWQTKVDAKAKDKWERKKCK